MTRNLDMEEMEMVVAEAIRIMIVTTIIITAIISKAKENNPERASCL